jgi:uncharacterized protein (TIGR02266 family)
MKIVFPVRFAPHQGLGVQTTSLELTGAGVFVPCPQRRPSPASLVTMQLYLPDRKPPAGAIGRVREQRGAEGFWLDVVDVVRGVRERLQEMMSGQPSRIERRGAEGTSPHRAMPRYPTSLGVAIDLGGKLIAASTRNMSASGLFLHTAEHVAPGTTVALRLALPDRDRPLSVRARVVHAVELNVASMPWAEAGLGVQFVDGDDSFRERIDRHLARIAGP